MSSSDLSGYNTNDGDGCSSLCAIELNFICSGGSVLSPDSCSVCPAGLSPDATKTSCVATCGDSKRTSSETCDDGDTTSGDGCSSSCAIEAGLICNGGTTSSPDVCNICSAGLTQSQTALFVSHIVETAREQVRRLVMTEIQQVEMDAVLYVQSSQTIFEVEDQYHLQIRVQYALQDYKEYGQGTYDTKNGDKYAGQWDGNYEGQVEINFKDGTKNIWKTGDCYIGEFKGGRLNDEGPLYNEDGGRYEGGWNDGWYKGQGTYYTKDEDKYTGQWNDWKGQGEIKYKDGKKYTGHWNGGYSNNFKRHGLGILYSADGQVLNQGKWGKVQSVGKE